MKGFFDAIENIATPEKPVSQEKLPEFVYVNLDSGDVVYKCNAVSMDEADKMFEAEFHIDPKDDQNIACAQENGENK